MDSDHASSLLHRNLLESSDDDLSSEKLRAQIRSGDWRKPTAGELPGYQQANLVVLPEPQAFAFLLFCLRNPQACPVIAVTEPGDPRVQLHSGVADLRTDIPKYRVWQDGVLVDEPFDVNAYWQPDHVGFLLGCSHTFEGALESAGLFNTAGDAPALSPVYITNRQTEPAGSISGPLAVSMRSFRPDQIAEVVQITARYPTGHGRPIHIGSPGGLGIHDIHNPDFGPAPVLNEDEIPVFWACGITPQLVLPEVTQGTLITHYPGHMFIFDHQPTAQF